MSGWARAEPWGTDHHTYPSKTVEDKKTLGKRTDVQEYRSTRKPVLGDLKRGPDLPLIGIGSVYVDVNGKVTAVFF